MQPPLYLLDWRFGGGFVVGASQDHFLPFRFASKVYFHLVKESVGRRRTLKRTHVQHAPRGPTVPVGPNLATAARASADQPPGHLSTCTSTPSINPFRRDSPNSLGNPSVLRAESSEPGFAATGAFVFHAQPMRAAPVAACRRAGASSASRGATSAACLLYTSPSPRDRQKSRMPSSA